MSKKHNDGVSPGEMLRVSVEASGKSYQEFAKSVGMNAWQLSHVMANRRPITPKTALKLATATDLTAEQWLIIQAKFELQKAMAVSRG